MAKELRVTEELMMFILNKREKSLKRSSDYTQTVSIIAGILYELLNGEYIQMDDKKKITINENKEKPTTNYCLAAYDYIANDKKTRKIDDLIVKLIEKNELYHMVQTNLSLENCIEEVQKKVLIFTQSKIVVNEAVLENIIQQIRTEFLEAGELSDDIAFLTFMLYQNNMLRGFFSKHENEKLKKRLKEIKNEPIGKIAQNVIDSISSTIVVTTMVATSN